MPETLFGHRDLSGFDSYEEAYHQLILDIVRVTMQLSNIQKKAENGHES